MKHNTFPAAGLLCAAFAFCASPAAAQNPIIHTKFTPDPAPFVHNDTVYLFADHDEPDAQYFKMTDWLLYSSADMVNWTYRGTPLGTATFKWAKQGDNAWASQATERNGKWYWYICAEDTAKHLHGIGVAVADRPEGPYTDPLGKPLVPGSFGYIDPSVFIDDDGQAYLFWGNNGCWYAPLADDMISLAGEVRPVPDLQKAEAFGPLVMKRNYATNSMEPRSGYEEGPWVFKRNGTYYMVYASGGVPEHMAYSTAQSIHGPWTYQGRIMDEAQNSFTIHGGSIEFGGRWFMFYHNGALPNGGGFRRSTCVEEFEWTADGRLPFMPFTAEGVKTPVRNTNPFGRIEAETMAAGFGLKTDNTQGTHHYIHGIDNGDWLRVRAVDFGAGKAKEFAACVATAAEGASIEMRLDGLGGKVIAELKINPTGATDKWQLQSAPITQSPEGVHDVYLLFKGAECSNLFHFDYWMVK